MNASETGDEGVLDEAMRSRLGVLAAGLHRTYATLRYVGYEEAEHDCERLAAKILQLYSREDLRSFRFTPIPRGGLIVLGMLSYVLGLEPEQLQPGLDPSKPLFIVDDCSLSGARFAHMLRKTTSPHVAFAHLYSHPDLRQAIVSEEQRVRHCVAAHDLVDHASQRYSDPSDYEAWRQCWQKLLGGPRYWVGELDLICFAWSEPNQPFWNRSLGRMEDGWRFVPPHLCLNNRASLGLPTVDARSVGWRVPSSVVSGWFDDVLWLCQTDTGQVHSLVGVGADIWRALAAYGDLDVALEYLLTQYRVEKGELERDLSAFANDLLAKDLLERGDAPEPHR